jgi:hypothetical protein
MRADKVGRRGAICVWPVATALIVVSVLCATSPALADDGPLLQLTSDPPETVRILTPGESAAWNVGVTTRAATVESLVGAVRASGPLAAAAPDTTIAIASCRVPWQGSECTGNLFAVLAPTKLANLSDSTLKLTDVQQPIPRGLYIQVRVGLPSDTPLGAQGSDLTVKLKVVAAGRDEQKAATRLSAHMASTGLDVVGFGLLGAIAVAAGCGVTAFARRHRGDRV